MGHARNERVLLFGTDQQITSGQRPNGRTQTHWANVELRIRATLAEARLADLRSSLDDMREHSVTIGRRWPSAW